VWLLPSVARPLRSPQISTQTEPLPGSSLARRTSVAEAATCFHVLRAQPKLGLDPGLYSRLYAYDSGAT
jgi:hypothetical protein